MDHNKLPVALKVILERKSVRDYTGTGIKPEFLDLIVQSAMAAPSSSNLQPWNFILITDRKILDLLADGLPYAKMLYKAGAAIVVCGTPDRIEAELSDYWVQDCSAASQNILLAIEVLGLGGVWTGVYPRANRVNFVKKTLNIPDYAVPLNVIAIGHPLTAEKPKNKFDPVKVHIDNW
jgi:nitroreductase